MHNHPDVWSGGTIDMLFWDSIGYLHLLPFIIIDINFRCHWTLTNIYMFLQACVVGGRFVRVLVITAESQSLWTVLSWTQTSVRRKRGNFENRRRHMRNCILSPTIP